MWLGGGHRNVGSRCLDVVRAAVVGSPNDFWTNYSRPSGTVTFYGTGKPHNLVVLPFRAFANRRRACRSNNCRYRLSVGTSTPYLPTRGHDCPPACLQPRCRSDHYLILPSLPAR
jgi:hypothetical protein